MLIDTLYGCTSSNPIGNAREPKRLQQLSNDQTLSFVGKARKLGMRFAWTINTSCVGNVDKYTEWWKENQGKLKEYFQFLNPDFLIVAHPLIMILIRESGIDIPIEISTIADIQEPKQVLALVDIGINVKRICLPVHRNRDFKYLESMSAMCKELGIEVEVIANEFCFLDQCNCNGLFRHSCYDMNAHAHEGTAGNNKYPRDLCVMFRERDPANWLRAKWILPQHMRLYEDIGINHFKITGRTHPTAFLAKILPYYMAREFKGNLLELWPHLQTINSEKFQDVQKKLVAATSIPTDRLDEFFRHVLHYCTNDCYTCRFCHDFYTRKL